MHTAVRAVDGGGAGGILVPQQRDGSAAAAHRLWPHPTPAPSSSASGRFSSRTSSDMHGTVG